MGAGDREEAASGPQATAESGGAAERESRCGCRSAVAGMLLAMVLAALIGDPQAGSGHLALRVGGYGLLGALLGKSAGLLYWKLDDRLGARRHAAFAAGRPARVRWSWRAWLRLRTRWPFVPRNVCVVWRPILATCGIAGILYAGTYVTPSRQSMPLALLLTFGAVYFLLLLITAPSRRPGVPPGISGTSTTGRSSAGTR